MDSCEFNEEAELYDSFAGYDREALVVLVGQLIIQLIKTGALNRTDFLANIDRCIAPDPQTDDQVSHRLMELRSYLQLFA